MFDMYVMESSRHPMQSSPCVKPAAAMAVHTNNCFQMWILFGNSPHRDQKMVIWTLDQLVQMKLDSPLSENWKDLGVTWRIWSNISTIRVHFSTT